VFFLALLALRLSELLFMVISARKIGSSPSLKSVEIYMLNLFVS